MSKPIVIIYIDIVTLADQPIGRTCSDTMENLNKKMPDYYWFCVPDYAAERVEFKVFYDKDFTTTQYEELKKLIQDAVNQTKNHD